MLSVCDEFASVLMCNDRQFYPLQHIFQIPDKFIKVNSSQNSMELSEFYHLLQKQNRIARPEESQLKLKVDFHRVPYNQTYDFVTGQFVRILSPTCSWKMSITVNRLEYFDKILHTHWYWQDVAQEIVECHFGLAEALPRFQFWKSENGPISLTEWNIVMKFCIHIDIDMM